MAKKLYVGQLSYDTTNESLTALFAQYGEVASAMIIMDKMTGRSKGFGFVEMASDDDAAKAIEALNGTEFEGRKIIVNEARPMEERPARRPFSPRQGGGRGGYGGGRSW